MSTSKSPRSADDYLNPERIGIARMRRGLTKVELAQRLSVTARTVTKYESEGAPGSVGAALAAALDFPESYFVRGDVPALCASEVSFRAARRATARQREAAVAAGVAGMEIDQWITRRFVLPTLDLPIFDGQGPKTAAAALRSMWGLGTKPLPNLVQLCESRGIRVYTLPPFADVVDAYSVWRNDVPFVFLARRKTPERIRFDLAHELGHLVLHSAEPAETAAHEREADVFASEFLIPEDSLAEYMRFNPSVDELLRVKNHFKVSAMAMAYATYHGSRMGEWVYRHTCMTLSQQGFRSGEPGGMANYEMSRVFPQVFGAASVSGAAIAQDLAIPISDVHALTFGAELRVVQDNEVTSAITRQPTKAVERHLRVV
ncbi:helix-turn-helix domain-containing protein [Mycolicibacterium fortuitum]|uniref:helix-turn-helix domain-containing protein n=1 Tax=Mycolicibacterium fortuitum TaxID=1766 RepID=UPI00262C632F|nr:XRE family transcriptional regulator [Mycolicibacterium fortuitum]